MKSLNKIELIGHIGQEPVVRKLESGTTVTTMSMATTETYKDAQGQKQSTTYWHNLVLWAKLAEIAEQYVKKGDRLFVEGKLTHRTYTAQDGTNRNVSEIVVKDMIMLNNKPQNAPGAQSTPPEPQGVQTTANNEEDDLPF
ncbi:single-stranded DNA-binding protein [Arenibacter sp. 6A1]|uniref:single-stranded DNA-binding protein n=1 Tax=Arenibacter sp. 6A1 TaxID=2720391 RepID=UPI001444ECFD|nr:single-stranded DNA-binding protein [Arenibacter sp. 6A1]NKI28245.1 single-stranded DNA-binding protein [Arenibacter sp. 6A1]